MKNKKIYNFTEITAYSIITIFRKISPKNSISAIFKYKIHGY